jgi:biopolymer transport protein ExbD
MSGSVKSEANAEPNLTPMLDMVFQLITFFMLVINFKAASMDLDLKLPVVGSARPVETGGKDLLVLNINEKGRLRVYGREERNIEAYLQREAMASMLANKYKNPDIKLGDELPTTIVIRADRATPFKLLNRVIKAAQDNGFRNFSMKATNKEA